jgi:1-acyl-sn-glycerol-3-phosphate acyltransferase
VAVSPSAPKQGLTEGESRRFHEALARLSPAQGHRERVLRALLTWSGRLVGWRVLRHGRLDRAASGVRPGAGCVVAVAPHRAWVEPFLLFVAWPAEAARLVWLADGRTVSRSWWRRQLLPHLGIIPVEGRVTGPRRYADLAAAALATGHALVIFPEVGPPSEADRPRRISPGFAFLALHASAPVIPVVVGGTHHIVRGSHFSVDLLACIDPAPTAAGAGDRASLKKAHEMAASLDESTRELLPIRNAECDALAPSRDRWRWLASMLR